MSTHSRSYADKITGPVSKEPGRLVARFDSISSRFKRGRKPHRAQLFHEGWAVDCECGWRAYHDTRAGVEELHAMHVDEHKGNPQ